eukprot:TRINITY_DN29281_c0_g1_i1.p1 TRINITY_DN29281_c0_g1~~TRINITY_DN29281_c0_g1_i1.p1  ORF type:complete len:471 (+),score=140.20 TRINITY_DN29281_c0_g1_i1:68-1480(+)
MAAWTEQWKAAISKIRGDVGYEVGASQLRELVKSGLLKLTDLKNEPERFFEAHRLLAWRCPEIGCGFWIRFTVHYNLFAGTVLAVGSDEQVAKLEDFQRKGLLGCFGLTEKLAGVNSGMVVNTTAEWDDAAKEFVLNTADSGAHKNWISQGLVGDLAVVMADLRVGSKRCGPHAFLVELRRDGNLMPGVELGDMGRKTVGNDLDNAWIGFHSMRVPHDTLLSKYCEVQPGNGGTYVSKAKGFNNMAMIGQRLYSGRVAVGQAALNFSRSLFQMTKQYSDSKACWAPGGGTAPLTNVPQLGALYVRADKRFERVEAFLGECERRLAAHLRKSELPNQELQEAIAVAKIVASETSIDLSFRLKQEVGSHALMAGTGFENMDMLQACKFAEGDSRILMQKLARDRAKSSKPIGSQKEQALVESLKKALKDGGQKAWDENFEQVYDLAWCVCERVVDKITPGEVMQVPVGLSKL